MSITIAAWMLVLVLVTVVQCQQEEEQEEQQQQQLRYHCLQINSETRDLSVKTTTRQSFAFAIIADHTALTFRVAS